MTYSCRRHFYLKRDSILAQCDEWIAAARAETDADVLYENLVVSHNAALVTRFAGARGTYAAMLQEAVADLRGELAKLEAPTIADASSDASDGSNDADADA